jgi:hypothetical protein
VRRNSSTRRAWLGSTSAICSGSSQARVMGSKTRRC